MFEGFEAIEVAATGTTIRGVRGGPVAAGRFLPEEAPEETARQLLAFLAEAPR